ncbi:MAG: hypothetical protein WC817_02585 [Patescibacteria group bacterium]|jgi:hypothetical protein
MFLPSFIFLIVIVVLLVLSRLISRTLFKLLGEGWYIVLLWPGVIVHEGSHFLGALLTFTPVRGFSLLPETGGSGSRVLGVVRHDRPKNPFASVIISGFPLIGGTVAIWLLTVFLLPGLSSSILTSEWQGGGYSNLLNSFRFLIKRGSEVISFGSWQTWLFLYLSFTISAHLAPSSHDLKYVAKGLIGLVVILGALYWLASFIKTSMTHNVLVWLVAHINEGISKILFAFLYLAFISIVVTVVSLLLLSIKKRLRRY